MAWCWRSISLRMRLSSGEALSASEPSGLSRERQEWRRLDSCAPGGSWLRAVSPGKPGRQSLGRPLDQGIPRGDRVDQKQQIADLLGLETSPCDPSLAGQLRWIEQSPAGRRRAFAQQQTHLLDQGMLSGDPVVDRARA